MCWNMWSVHNCVYSDMVCKDAGLAIQRVRPEMMYDSNSEPPIRRLSVGSEKCGD